ncbi:amidohydrolase family protein [Nocardia jiangsuensis]|uniref:Amidohydrolase family protein n=1 Tax=Nocardia jiangsuensis TaxID=1691563 RepID=A0ABV8DZ07_9NOCA
MLSTPDGRRIPLIDASVHIFFRSDADFRGFLREPYRSRGIPDVEMDWYGAPGGEYAPGTTGPTGQYPGSDPNLFGHCLFEQRGVDLAILHPMSRGILPDRHLTSAVLAAHNEMMVSRWLESGQYAERFRGTLRVCPDDIAGAVREIRRWRGNAQIVQIGIPLQSRELYGKPQYWPLWEAAQEAGWPVAVHIETGSGVENPPTPSGHPRSYEQYAAFMPLNYVYHLMNMIAEGVFERFPALKFVWADGGGDMLTPFSWRMDTFGRPHLEQTPWAPRMPSDYLPGHVHFVQGRTDGPGDVDFAGEWLAFTGKEDMVMFGSSYPHWQLGDPALLPRAWSAEQRDKVCWRNAAGLYGLELPAAVGR